MLWTLKQQPANLQQLHSWARKLNISPLLALLLNQRGLTSCEQMHFFLNPGLRYLSPLDKWPNLLSAARLVARSVTRGEKLAVWGDYDVDGITATAVIKNFFSAADTRLLIISPTVLRTATA